MRSATRPGPATLVAILLAAAAGCTFNHNLDIKPRLDALPASPPEPVTLGVYYSPEFSAATYSRLIGSHRYVFAIGRDSATTIDAVAGRAFQKVVRLDGLPPFTHPTPAVDLIVEPQLESFHFRTGMERDAPEHGIRYRLNFYTKEGVPSDARSVNGKMVPARSHFTVFREVDDHMEDAAGKLLQEFHRLPDPAAPPRDLTSPGASSGLAVTATPRQGPLRVGQGPPLQLAEAGIISVDVSVKNGGDGKVAVREADMRLVLPGGRTIATSGTASIPSRLEKRSHSGDVAAAFLGPLGGLMVMASESARQNESRAKLLAGLAPMTFGVRELAPGEEARGIVFFMPAPGTPPIAGADLSVWLLEADTKSARRVSAPVDGLRFTPTPGKRPQPVEPDPGQ